MSPHRTRASTVLPALLLLGTAFHATAAPCGRPDVDATFPPNNASSVPPNALLSAHYASPALYDDEVVSLIDASGTELDVSVAYDEADAMLRATPAAPLEPGYHELIWPGLRSLTGAGVGRGRTTGFFVQPASCFARSSPRFEAWVLGLPGIGPMVADFRAGLGMPRRVKVLATSSIVVAVGLSAGLALDGAAARVSVLLLGAVGVWFVGWRIPTREAVLAARTEAAGSH